MIGPELTSGTLEAIAALTSTESAPPLGSHSAVGKLVAIRYGAALADPQVAAMVARAKGQKAARVKARPRRAAPAMSATVQRPQRHAAAAQRRRRAGAGARPAGTSAQ